MHGGDTLRRVASMPPVTLGPPLVDGSHAPSAEGKRREKLPGVTVKGFKHERIGILFFNIRGLISHLVELTSVVRLLPELPALICLNETFLNRSVEEVNVEGYTVVARRDRDDGRKCGGVIVYAQDGLASRVTLIEQSADSERVWLIIHTDVGPYLVGVWYRPPEPGETNTIKSLETEWELHNQAALGTILVRDMNVHHRRWLRFSSENSAEGEMGTR